MEKDLKDYRMMKFKENKPARAMPFFSEKGMIVFGILLILLAVFVTSQDIMCDDFYWHISVGEWIVENHEIPMKGIFSWTGADTPWFAHEWLAEIIMYWFSLLGASFGGWLYFTISITLMFTMIYFMNKKEINRNYMAGMAAWILLVVATKMVGSARPHMLSMSFFIYLLYSLEQLRKNENSKLIYFTPLVTLIWANYHGGTVMFIPILFLIYICSSLFNFNFMSLQGKKLNKKQLMTLLIMFGINMLVVCINPHGFELITYPFSYSNIATKYIGEWQSPSWKTNPFAIILIIVNCVVLFLTKKKLQFTDLGVIGTMMMMTLVYIRFVWWLAVVMIFFLLKYIPAYNAQTLKTFKCVVLLVLFIGIICILLPTYEFGISESVFTDEAIQVIKDTEYNNLFNVYDAGNILIYHDIDVFLDGRSDMYQHVLSDNIYQDKESENYDPELQISVLEEGMNFENYAVKNMGDFIDKYELDLFMVSRKSRCRFYLESRDDVELLYHDDYTYIYKLNREGAVTHE
jgi:hypothetical protein